ncbi:MAG: hypothetical protein AAGD14_03740 [Planctomycetota bacterium]
MKRLALGVVVLLLVVLGVFLARLAGSGARVEELMEALRRDGILIEYTEERSIPSAFEETLMRAVAERHDRDRCRALLLEAARGEAVALPHAFWGVYPQDFYPSAAIQTAKDTFHQDVYELRRTGAPREEILLRANAAWILAERIDCGQGWHWKLQQMVAEWVARCAAASPESLARIWLPRFEAAERPERFRQHLDFIVSRELDRKHRYWPHMPWSTKLQYGANVVPGLERMIENRALALTLDPSLVKSGRRSFGPAPVDVPGPLRALEIYLQTLVSLRTARATFVVQRERARTGVWPDSLASLFPDGVPVSPFSGKPLTYQPGQWIRCDGGGIGHDIQFGLSSAGWKRAPR